MRSIARCVLPVLVGPRTARTRPEPGPAAAISEEDGITDRTVSALERWGNRALGGLTGLTWNTLSHRRLVWSMLKPNFTMRT